MDQDPRSARRSVTASTPSKVAAPARFPSLPRSIAERARPYGASVSAACRHDGPGASPPAFRPWSVPGSIPLEFREGSEHGNGIGLISDRDPGIEKRLAPRVQLGGVSGNSPTPTTALALCSMNKASAKGDPRIPVGDGAPPESLGPKKLPFPDRLRITWATRLILCENLRLLYILDLIQCHIAQGAPKPSRAWIHP
jgi:hypothetical protein